MHIDRQGRRYIRYYILHDGRGNFLSRQVRNAPPEMQRYTREQSEAWFTTDSTTAYQLANTLKLHVMALNAYE